MEKWEKGPTYPCPSKINRHHHQRDYPCQGSDKRTQQASDHAGANGEQESNKGNPARDRVQDHRIGERVRGIGGRLAEAGAIDLGHDGGGRVADVAGIAVVLVGAAGS